MRVFYYQHEGRTHLVSVGDANASSKSPIWRNCNTCSWLVPFTFEVPLPDELPNGVQP